MFREIKFTRPPLVFTAELSEAEADDVLFKEVSCCLICPFICRCCISFLQFQSCYRSLLQYEAIIYFLLSSCAQRGKIFLLPYTVPFHDLIFYIQFSIATPLQVRMHEVCIILLLVRINYFRLEWNPRPQSINVFMSSNC